MQEKQVAVLIDGDNISPKYAEFIREEAARLGRIKILRLYGSISSSSVRAWYKVMPQYGIMPMLQLDYILGKSIADQALTIDTMDILYAGEVDIICLVTSDCDFTKLAYRIKESGKEIVGMGEQKTNEAFAKACDEFKVLDLIYSVQENEEKGEINLTDTIESSTSDVMEEEVEADETKTINIPTEEEIVDSILNILDDDWENLAGVGVTLNKQISGFDSRNYGYKNMTRFIKGHQDKFELNVETAKDGIHSVVYIKKKKTESD